MKRPVRPAWIALLAGCILHEPVPLTRFEFMQHHMGTPVRIKFYAETPEHAEQARQAAFAEVAAVDAAMSDYKTDSELSLLSGAAGFGEKKVSAPLFEVLQASLHYSEISGGAFDITVGPVVRLWRRAREEPKLPEPAALRAALDLVGYEKVRLDPARRTARLEKAGMMLDLGGIAKGYACDRALAALARLSVPRAMVDTGGGMALGDPPPGEMGWKIQVADDPTKVLLLSRCGVATSGDWERFVEVEGKRYSHIVDPKTGLGLTHRALVTVVAPDGMSADALSTTVSVLGPERGLRLAEALPDTEAWMRWLEGGLLRTAQTSGFPTLLMIK